MDDKARVKEMMQMPKKQLVKLACDGIDQAWLLIGNMIHLGRQYNLSPELVKKYCNMENAPELFKKAVKEYDESVEEAKKVLLLLKAFEEVLHREVGDDNDDTDTDTSKSDADDQREESGDASRN